jgi:hypothetical protein
MAPGRFVRPSRGLYLSRGRYTRWRSRAGDSVGAMTMEARGLEGRVQRTLGQANSQDPSGSGRSLRRSLRSPGQLSSSLPKLIRSTSGGQRVGQGDGADDRGGGVKGFRPLTALFRYIAARLGVRHPSPGDVDEDLPTHEGPLTDEPE